MPRVTLRQFNQATNEANYKASRISEFKSSNFQHRRFCDHGDCNLATHIVFVGFSSNSCDKKEAEDSSDRFSSCLGENDSIGNIFNLLPSPGQISDTSVYYVCENCVLLMDTAMKDWVNDGCANCFNFLIKYSSRDYVIHIENVVVDFRSGIQCISGLNSFTAVDMKRSFIEQFVQNKVYKKDMFFCWDSNKSCI